MLTKLSHAETAALILVALSDEELYAVVREAVSKRFAACANDPARRDELIRFCRGLITA